MKKSIITTLILASGTMFAAELKTITLPFEGAFDTKQPGFMISGKVENKLILSGNKYTFMDVVMPASEKGFTVTVELKGTSDSQLGAMLYENTAKNTVGKRHAIFVWQKNVPAEFTKYTWTVTPDKSTGMTRLVIYNCTRKPEITIKSLKIEETK